MTYILNYFLFQFFNMHLECGGGGMHMWVCMKTRGQLCRVRYVLHRDSIQVTRLAQTHLCPQSYVTGPWIVFYNNTGQLVRKTWIPEQGVMNLNLLFPHLVDLEKNNNFQLMDFFLINTDWCV